MISMVMSESGGSRPLRTENLQVWEMETAASPQRITAGAAGGGVVDAWNGTFVPLEAEEHALLELHFSLHSSTTMVL